MKVLLVEDDATIADAIIKTIGRTEFRADHVMTLAEASNAITDTEVELMILDLGLPDGDGMRFLQTLRRKHIDLPIIILTARDRPDDRVNGLDHGADDYVVKPFDMAELIARMRAIKRRSAGRASNSISYGRLKLQPDNLTTLLDDTVVHLPVSQFRLLHYLLETQGKVKTKRQIIDALYLWDQNVEENTIEVYISQLRKSLWTDVIKTIRGIGYIMPSLDQAQ